PSRARTSYSARLPSGPESNVEARKSSSGSEPPLRRPATTATVIASASSTTSASSNRRDMLQHEIGGGGEVPVLRVGARYRPENVAVQPADEDCEGGASGRIEPDRKSTRLNSSHDQISYAVFCLKKKKKK